MRGFSLILLLAALAIAGYLYKQSIQQTARTLGAQSPLELRQKTEDLGKAIEQQTMNGVRHLDEQLRQQER
jgi:hypothetical protein